MINFKKILPVKFMILMSGRTDEEKAKRFWTDEELGGIIKILDCGKRDFYDRATKKIVDNVFAIQGLTTLWNYELLKNTFKEHFLFIRTNDRLKDTIGFIGSK